MLGRLFAIPPRFPARPPPMTFPAWFSALALVLDFAVRLWLAYRIVMRRLPVGVSLAWLLVILVFPFLGSIGYLLLGEYHLGWHRLQRILDVEKEWRVVSQGIASLGPIRQLLEHPEESRLARLAASTFLAPPLQGNELRLLDGADEVFPALLEDIDAAQESCDFLFYIWSSGGRVDQVEEALRRAAARGVRCRILVDAMGSSAFLRDGRAEELRRAGIAVQPALPSGLLSLPFVRPDLRLHRKIIVIDHKVGYTGSLNMADPVSFKQDAGVGQWVDAMVRTRGPVVLAMAASFLSFWSVETAQEADRAEWMEDAHKVQPVGSACVQVLSSGPAVRVEAMEQVVLTALYSARREVILTTPYFVPSESLLTALLSVAGSGVAVTLILPAQVDSALVRFASRAYQKELVDAGIRVALYEGGLLHTKSITIDDSLTLFGSLNLDPRSLRLNFEITLTVYDEEFNGRVKALQTTYLQRCRIVNEELLRRETHAMQFVQNTARLLGPVL